jgi:peptidoglycan/LPS O-acetylase OafA/YrhL
VALGHLTLPYFSTGWSDWMEEAGAAVIAFFLLSGFIIRYVTTLRQTSIGDYAADRATRIYSVLLPATLLTICTDIALGRNHWVNIAFTSLETLSFTAFSWHQQTFFYTNGAMWSISFECMFYALFGTYFYLRGYRRYLLVGLVALIAGPEILSLFPIWLIGCLLYDIFLGLRRQSFTLLATVIVVTAALLGSIGWRLRRYLAHAHQQFGDWLHALQASAELHRAGWWSFVPRIGHGTPYSLNAYIYSIVFSVIILTGLLVFERIPINPSGLPRRGIGLLAEGTFTLYLFHLPLYAIAISLIRHPVSSLLGKLALLVGVVVISTALGPLFDAFKERLRCSLRR